MSKDEAREQRVQRAIARCALSGTVLQLQEISDFCDKLVATGEFTDDDRRRVNEAVKKSVGRIRASEASPFNPDNR
jgi:polyhydroxyalkanoate synthesis regulator phasin